jgi:hypothetical protein
MEEEMNGLWAGIFVFWMLGSWMTHVIACIQSGEWLFLIAGALFFPIAIIHGTGVWFGAW